MITDAPGRTLDAVIVGAGFGGVAAARELLGHGFADLVVLDEADGVGGTWHWNDYPGAACDVPSAFYSYSFAQRSDWTRFCPPRDEILTHLRATADRLGVTGLVRTGERVTSCVWDEPTATWTVRTDTTDGDRPRTYRARAVVLATGQLHRPAYPGIPGLDTFAGHAFHSARWDHDYDLTGKRVAVIGTGASAVQFVPEIVGPAARTTVFQRTGNWFLPRQNNPFPDWLLTLLRRVPPLHRAYRALLFLLLELLTLGIRHPRTVGRVGRLWSSRFMRGQLTDPDVRARAWPDYTFGCKRVLFSSRFLPALQRPDVELVTDAITGMTPAGPRTADGRVHEVDCVIYGTGFRTLDFMAPMTVVGRGGRTLQDAWAHGPRAHLGITVPGFPSLFLLYGPNTNTSGGSIIFFLEAQARYARQALELGRARHAALDVRGDVLAADDRATQARFSGTAWTQCSSWYRSEHGRIVTNWPGYMREYAAATRRVDPRDFELLTSPVIEPSYR